MTALTVSNAAVEKEEWQHKEQQGDLNNAKGCGWEITVIILQTMKHSLYV